MTGNPEKELSGHTTSFVIIGEAKDEAELILEADKKQKETEEQLRFQGAKLIGSKREIKKIYQNESIKISTSIYFKSGEGLNVMFGVFSGSDLNIVFPEDEK